MGTSGVAVHTTASDALSASPPRGTAGGGVTGDSELAELEVAS